jgi:hypothetical protein
LRLRFVRIVEFPPELEPVGDDCRVDAAVPESGDDGWEMYGEKWPPGKWLGTKACGDGYAESGVDMGVSGGDGAPEEGDEWEETE